MPFSNVLSDKKLWLLLLTLVLLRLPNINRPLSNHHEFNTAVILINAESWQQAGGGRQLNYTPLLTYQGKANHLLEKGWHIDKKGNHVYLSFGAGWYVIPYFIFTAAHISFSPLNLQILSILIGLITTIMLYALLLRVTANRNHALAGALLFSLLPAPLWYCGIAYVTTAIMLPVVIAVLYLWHLLETDAKNINSKNLVALFLLSIALCYIDWIAVFLFIVIGVWAIFKSGKNSRYGWIFFVAVAGVFTGVFLVLGQFASYLGWKQVLHYWQSRFADRSTDTGLYSFAELIKLLFQNFITGYLPLFLVFLFALSKKLLKKNVQNIQWPLWVTAAIIPYNGIFFNWSALHEFAWLAFGLIATIAITVYVFPMFSGSVLKRMLIVTSLLSVVIYIVINLPGGVNIKGKPYNQQQQLGNWIREHADTSLPIFINLNNDKIVEYYSKRSFNTAWSLAEAKAVAAAFKIDSALWIEIKNNQVEKISRFYLRASH